MNDNNRIGVENNMQSILKRSVIVCALGYFIDIFDIQLFAVLRVPSLTELGVSPDQLSVIGGYILNAQMLGMVLGAFLWGILGDKYGRLKALYGSILVYSIGTLACSFVHDPLTYGFFRFIAGFGLAGETGVAITLIAELMSGNKRGWGITIIGGIGNFGPVLAIVLSWYLNWRATYGVAGVIGLVLLVLRMRLVEPLLFQKAQQLQNRMGALQLLARPQQALIFLYCLALGLPLTYAVNLLNFFSLEISHVVLHEGQNFNQKTCMLLFYIGFGIGSSICNGLGQLLRNRRKALFFFMLLGASFCGFYLLICPSVKINENALYLINFIIGFSFSTLALVTLMTAEQFGTNVRATATSLIMNLVRAGVIPMIFVLQALKGTIGVAYSAAVLGLVIMFISFLSLYKLRETHGINLDFVEKSRE